MEIEKSRNNLKEKQKVRLIFYPDNSKVELWNVFIMLLLIVACVLTPLQLAIVKANDPQQSWLIAQYSIDICFFIDILVIFNTAIYDQNL